MKRGLLLSTFLTLTTFVSAYGGNSGISLGGFYLDIDLIASVAIFMGIFIALAFATRKIKLFHTEGARIFVSFILAMFSVYGLSKLNISYEEIFINLGIQNFLMSFSLIIIVLAIITIWSIWNFRSVIMTFSGSFLLLGFIGTASNIIYNWEISLLIGIILGAIYYWLRKKARKIKSITE